MRALLTLMLLVASPALAQQEGHFVLPGVGLGGGVGGRGFGEPLLRLDLTLGGEWRRPANDAMGFDLRLVAIGSLGSSGATTWYTLQAGFGFTYATSYDQGLPFAGFSTGPLLAATGLSTGEGGLGAGWQAEGALGFKSIVELFASLSLTLDRLGFAPALTGGIRVSSDLVWWFFFRPTVVIVRPASPPPPPPREHGAAPVGTVR